MAQERAEAAGPIDAFRQFFGLQRDVLVLSLAMFAFSLGFQMTNRFLPEYMVALGASGFVVGLFGTFGNVISAVYPYPGGAVSDRIGSRYALTLFGLLSTLGFGVWLVGPGIGAFTVGGVTVEPWIWIFVGLVLAQTWKSFGLGATFAVVKQAIDPSRLAAGFASTETFRRTAFLIGPVMAAVLIDLHPAFTVSFQYVLAVAVAFGILGTVVQHLLYDASSDIIGDSFAGVDQIRRDLRDMPDELVFAFSGLRFAGLPSHKALIVGPAEQGAGGRVTGTYYLLRNTVVIPSAAVGGSLWEFVTPEIAFTVAAAIGTLGTAYFLVFGEEFEAYE